MKWCMHGLPNMQTLHWIPIVPIYYGAHVYVHTHTHTHTHIYYAHTHPLTCNGPGADPPTQPTTMTEPATEG